MIAGILPKIVSRRPPVVFISLPAHEVFAKDRRLEGETYLTGGHRVRRVIERSEAPLKMISDLAAVWMPNRLKGIKVAEKHGTPFLTATQVFDIRPTPRKWLAVGKIANLEQLYTKPGWILITRSGSVGDVVLSYSAHSGIIVSDDLLRVQLHDLTELGYLYTFLRTRYGRSMLRSSQYGSIIKHLEPDHLLGICVPMADSTTRHRLAAEIKSVYELRERAYALTVEAEALYAKEIGIAPEEPTEEAGYSVAAAELFTSRRRLDGYYYNPAAEAAAHALSKSGKTIKPLREVVQNIFNVARFKHIYTKAGVPYLDSEDIFKINPEVTKFIPRPVGDDAPRVLKRMEKYHVKRDWLLMACSGQIYGLNGNVVLADNWHEQKVVSNHVLRIVPATASDAPLPGYLQIALSHPVLGRPLVLRVAFGTEVPELDTADIAEFPVPRLKPAVEKKIDELVHAASNARLEANQKEDAAVLAVEQAVDLLIGGPVADEAEEGKTDRARRSSQKQA